MSDLDNAINSINESAAKAENTATFLDDMSTFDDQSSVTNPNNGQTVASISKQVKDRTDELFTAAESDINQAVSDAAQSATDAQDAADSIGRYQGLWPDTGGIADKGDTYQTQVSGVPTGQYFTALQNTTVDPTGDNVNWRELNVIALIFNTVADLKAGITYDGRSVDTPNGTPVKTLGYYSAGDGGGFSYVVQPRSGGYGQNKVIEFPLNSDESIAVPIVSKYSGAVAGILPSVASSDLTKNFNELAGKAFSIGQKIIEVEQKADYYCESDLTNYYHVVFIGEGSIVSPQANNYYKRIYPKSAMTEVLSLNNANGSSLGRFLTAVEKRKAGGDNPVWVWVGDSLTQGAHRASDNYWYVKDFERKLVESFGPIDFYNRGIAGSAISQLDQVVQDTTPINAPFEPQWNVDNGKLLRDYVAELNPDCVSIAYGMNSGDSAVDTNAIITARANLVSLIPDSDLIWVTTPIRTTDLNPEFSGEKFGTYPNNEQSNQAGLVTRLLANSWGDYCVDVNRMSNIVQLGQDPLNLRMNRWAGQFKTLDNKFLNDQFITVEGDSTWTVDLTSANKITSTEMFRDCMVEFTVDASSAITDDFRVNLRKDPTGQGELLFQFLPTSVRLIGYKGSTGTQAIWNVNPTGKKFRIRAIGTEIILYIDDVATTPDSGSASDMYQSLFLAPIEVQVTGSTVVKLTNFLVNGGARSDYRQFVPRLTPYEVFNVANGDGGNNLNHPNTLGEREMYSQPIYEFVSWAAGKDVPKFTEFTDITVVGASGTLKAEKYDNTVHLHFEDFTVSGSTGSSPIVTLPSDLIPAYACSTTLARTNVTDQSKRLQVRSNGDVYITDGTGAATWAGSLSYRVS